MIRNIILCLIIASNCASPILAGTKGQAVKETVDFILKKFGKEAADQGAKTITKKTEELVLKYGAEAIIASKKIGPKIFNIVEEAGENGAEVVKLLARRGNEAVWVVNKKNRLAIFIKHGNDAADAMIKHGEIAEPLIKSLGDPASGALKSISSRNARRLAIMGDDGTLQSIQKADQLLEVVKKHGDRAMDFIWKNKGTLIVSSALIAFIADPEPFMDGTIELSKSITENVAKPLADIPGKVASEAASKIDWTWILSLSVILMLFFFTIQKCLNNKKLQ